MRGEKLEGANRIQRQVTDSQSSQFSRSLALERAWPLLSPEFAAAEQSARRGLQVDTDHRLPKLNTCLVSRSGRRQLRGSCPNTCALSEPHLQSRHIAEAKSS